MSDRHRWLRYLDGWFHSDECECKQGRWLEWGAEYPIIMLDREIMQMYALVTDCEVHGDWCEECSGSQYKWSLDCKHGLPR